MKIKAAICWEPNQPLEVEQIDLEGPKDGEVLVRLAASGVCHTDAYTLSGSDPEGVFPVVLGHEGAGVVEEIGAGVTAVAPGDHVVMSWIKGSGINTVPEKVPYGDIAINRGACTTFAEYTVVSENRVTQIPLDMPLKPAALIGCAVATGVGMVFNNARDKIITFRNFVKRNKYIVTTGNTNKILFSWRAAGRKCVLPRL